MLTFKEYTRAIDMWSVGCVLAEMLSGKPLFPGRDYHHQLSIILDVLGTPSLDDFYAISSHRSREYIRALPFRKKKPFATLFPTANPLAIDLLEQLLTFSPKNRIDVEGALAHPYLEVRFSSKAISIPLFRVDGPSPSCLASKPITIGSFPHAALSRPRGRTNGHSAGPQLLRFRLSDRSDQRAAQRYTLQYQRKFLTLTFCL
jgi:serine/threonine protein kinase